VRASPNTPYTRDRNAENPTVSVVYAYGEKNVAVIVRPSGFRDFAPTIPYAGRSIGETLTAERFRAYVLTYADGYVASAFRTVQTVHLPGIELKKSVPLHRLYVIAGQTYESGQREPPDDGQLICKPRGVRIRRQQHATRTCEGLGELAPTSFYAKTRSIDTALVSDRLFGRPLV